MKINLHIEQLVLDGLGLGGRDAARVEEALRAELTRLFMKDAGRLGSFASLTTPSVNGEPLRAPAAAPPQLGSAIAQSLHGVVVK